MPCGSRRAGHRVTDRSRCAAMPSPTSRRHRLNDTTRTYFERLAKISPPEEAARYNNIVQGKDLEAVQEYFAAHAPRLHSTLRTSISPNIIKGGYRVNVIPSEAEATLDIRALPDEDIPRLLEQIRQVINDPAVEVARIERDTRPGAKPSRLDTEAFRTIEDAVKRNYDVLTIPVMSTGATDMAYLRARGMQCYGIGPMLDSEDGPKGFGAHSDQERILEEALYKFVRFQWEIVVSLAAAE
jgi:acetylornithine deacetylase/succinyl-diaminopimelate desuccinylase-like protein